MFHIGQYVMYGHMGICRIHDIKNGRLMDDTVSDYYVIKTVDNNNPSTIMVAVDNEKIPMRRIMTRDEVDRLIEKIPEIDVDLISDARQRNKSQKEILRSGCPEDLIKLIKAYNIRKKQAQKQNKKLSASDSEIYKTAVKILENEFSFVLEIEPDDVKKYIKKRIKNIDPEIKDSIYT
jgi:RNA polymerase-interacting CarD/CdnL/TRCF family regulator